MRISEWSSDVCSSDLRDHQADRRDDRHHRLAELDGGPIERLLKADIIVEDALEREQYRGADDEVERRDRRDPEEYTVDQAALFERPELDDAHYRDDSGAHAYLQEAPGDRQSLMEGKG